jgi:predicted site-specific integrase-resolvase
MIITFNQAYEKYFKGLIGINKLREFVKTGKIPVVDIPSAKTYFDSDEIEI